MTIVGEAFVQVSPQLATSFAPNLARDVSNKIQGASSQFIRAGAGIGEDLAHGVTQGFDPEITDKLRSTGNDAARIGRGIGDDLGRGIGDGADEGRSRVGSVLDRIKNLSRSAGTKAGSLFGGGFAAQASEGTDRIRSSISKLATLVGGAFAVRAVFNFAKEGVAAASDLNESINAINVTLGTGAASFLNFGKTAADQLGLTQVELNNAIVPIGALLGNAGLSGEGLSNSLQAVATRATDVASVFNKDVNEVLLAFGSAIRGEAEPARAFGVNLDAAAISAEALRLGLAKTTVDSGKVADAQIAVEKATAAVAKAVKEHGAGSLEAADAANKQKNAEDKLKEALAGSTAELSQSAKTQAALSLLMSQTSKNAGDFANTQDGLANLTRRFTATLTEAKAALGTALLPALINIGQAAMALLPQIEPLLSIFGKELAGVLKELTPVVGGLIKALGPAVTAIASTLAPVGKILAAILVPIAGLIAPIAELFGSLLRAAEPFVAVLVQLASDVLPTLQPLLAGLIEGVRPIIAVLSVGLGAVLKELTPLILTVSELLGTALGKVGKMLAQGLGTVLKALAPQLPVMSKAILSVVTALLRILPALEPVIPLLAQGLAKSIASVGPMIPQIADAFVQLIDALVQMLPALIPLIPPLLRLALFIEKFQLSILLLLVKGFTELTKVLTPVVEVVGRLLASGIDKLVDLLAKIATGFSFDNLGKLGGILSDIGGAVGRFFTGLPGMLAELPGQIVAFFADLPGKIGTALTAMLTAIGLWVIENGPGIAEKFATLAGSALSWVASAVASIPGKLMELVAAVGAWVIKAGPVIAGKAVDLWLSLLSWIARSIIELPGKILGIELAVGRWVLDVAPKLVAKVAGLAVHLLSWIADAIRDAPGKLLELAGTVLTFLTNLPGTLTRKVVEIAPKLVTALLGIGKAIVQGISDGITGAVSGAVDIAKNLFKALAGFVNDHIISKVRDFKVTFFGKDFQPFGSFPLIPTTFAYGGLTTEGRIDGNGSNRREVVIPLERGRARIAELLGQSGIMAQFGLGSAAASGGTATGIAPPGLSSQAAAFLRLYAAADEAQRHYIDQVAAFFAALTENAEAALTNVATAAGVAVAGGRAGSQEDERGWNWRTMGNGQAGAEFASIFANGLAGDYNQDARISDEEWRRHDPRGMMVDTGWTGAEDALRGIAMLSQAVPATAEFFKIMSTAGPELYAYMAKIAAAGAQPSSFLTSLGGKIPAGDYSHLFLGGNRPVGGGFHEDERGYNFLTMGNGGAGDEIARMFANGLLGDYNQDNRITDAEWKKYDPSGTLNDTGWIGIADKIGKAVADHMATKPAPDKYAPALHPFTEAEDLRAILQLLKHIDYLFGGPGAHVKETNPKKGEPVTLNQWLDALNGSATAGSAP